MHRTPQDRAGRFDDTTSSWAAFDRGKLPEHRLVAVDERNAVLGWALTPRVPLSGPGTSSAANRAANRSAWVLRSTGRLSRAWSSA
jgi:hypothetical protein